MISILECNPTTSSSIREISRSSWLAICFCLVIAAGTVCRSAYPQQTAPPGVAVTEAPYRIEVGDTVEVTYRYTPEYNQTLTVLPDGTLPLQFLGPVSLAGLTVNGARDKLMGIASALLKHPQIYVSLKTFQEDHFLVLGEVGTQGRFELHGPTTIVDAIAMAGGFKATSSQSKVFLARRLACYSDGTCEFKATQILNFKELRDTRLVAKMPLLNSNDVVIVTTNKFTKVERIVKLANVGLYYPLPTF